MQGNDNDKKQSGLSWSAPAAKQINPATPVAPKMAPQPQMPVMPGMSNTARYAGFIAAGVILGVLIAWGAGAWRGSPSSGSKQAVVNSDNTPANTTMATDTGTVGTTASSADSSLSIASPQAPGTSVAILSAVVAAPTWVVIYEDQAGKPGNALGAALFFPGQPQGSVELLRATVSGKSYLAVRQVDDGNRKFSLHDDKYLTDESGDVQWVTFAVK